MRHYTISKHNKGWQLKQAKADRAQFVTGTKEEAVKKAAAWARANASDADPISVTTHGADGEIIDQRTYSYAHIPKASGVAKASGKALEFAGISSEGVRQLAPLLTRLKRYDEGR
jgi:hypothetical protein